MPGRVRSDARHTSEPRLIRPARRLVPVSLSSSASTHSSPRASLGESAERGPRANTLGPAAHQGRAGAGSHTIGRFVGIFQKRLIRNV
jgi:hypothetical protein